MKYSIVLWIVALGLVPDIATAQQGFANENATFALPTLAQKPDGGVILYWTEKDSQNKISLFLAESPDLGKTFGEKKLIYADAGIGTGRLARPKLLFKKNGAMVAVFAYRVSSPPPPASPAMEAGHGGHNQPAQAAPPVGSRQKRDTQIRFAESKDNGNTWSAPQSVDSDTAKLVRGFFDAVVLPNDEIAVAYLKDVKGSTKHEERDLRLVLTKNGIFQPEKLIDPVVCDCCNISLLVDQPGNLNVFYRDNNNDIRDIARLISKDNGQTFGPSEILYHDKWEINGCPHSGAVSVTTKQGAFVSWYSGSPQNPGIRVIDANGKLINILDESAKNQTLATDGSATVWVWEQSLEKGNPQLSYGVLKGDKMEAKGVIAQSNYAANPSALLVKGGHILIAHEVVKSGTKTGMQVLTVEQL